MKMFKIHSIFLVHLLWYFTNHEHQSIYICHTSVCHCHATPYKPGDSRNVSFSLNRLQILQFCGVRDILVCLYVSFRLLIYFIQRGDDGRLRMSHKSIKDFIFDHERSLQLFACFESEQLILAQRCLVILTTELRRDPCKYGLFGINQVKLKTFNLVFFVNFIINVLS